MILSELSKFSNTQRSQVFFILEHVRLILIKILSPHNGFWQAASAACRSFCAINPKKGKGTFFLRQKILTEKSPPGFFNIAIQNTGLCRCRIGNMHADGMRRQLFCINISLRKKYQEFWPVLRSGRPGKRISVCRQSLSEGWKIYHNLS